jgi:DNA polymerase-3 subunit alpha
MYYRITPISDFNEFKDAIQIQKNPLTPFRLAGLITDTQHRITKTGKQFGIFTIEDYNGKTEMAVFGEDYVKFKEHFSNGAVVFVMGAFKNRWNKEGDFEFKMEKVLLLETIKKMMTKKVTIKIEPRFVSEKLISFLENNIKNNPGKTSLQVELFDPADSWKISLFTAEKGVEMNDELTEYLLNSPELEVSALTL